MDENPHSPWHSTRAVGVALRQRARPMFLHTGQRPLRVPMALRQLRKGTPQLMIFKNQTHQDIWIEHHCERCARHPGCPIVAKAIRTKRKPPQWDRNKRSNVLMQDSIKCNEECRKLPITRAPRDFEDIPMFDVTPIAGEQDSNHA